MAGDLTGDVPGRPPVAAEAPVLVRCQPTGVALVTLNRPAALNAVNAAIARALHDTVEALEADRSVRAVVLTGAGERAFCAGGDLVEIGAGRWPALSIPGGGFAGFTEHPRCKPWIAAIRGVALGGGLEIALACDMIVAAADARLGLPEVTRGVIAAAGGIYRLPKRLPRNIALELIATGEMMSADRAVTLGLVNHVVPPERDPLDFARVLAERIAGNAPIAVQESLRVARAAADGAENAIKDMAAAALALVMGSADAREGPLAFRERRPPNWTGT